MAERGGRKAPDYRQRVAGPGRFSKRTDLDGNQPIRIAPGGPYGSAKQQESLQQARRLPTVGGGIPAPGPAQGSPAAGTTPGAGMPPLPMTPQDPLAARDMLGAMTGGAGPRTPRQVSASEAAIALENMIARIPGPVSASTMAMLMRLKREALNSPSPELDDGMDYDPDLEDTIVNFDVDGLGAEIDQLDDTPLVLDDDAPLTGQPQPDLPGEQPPAALPVGPPT